VLKKGMIMKEVIFVSMLFGFFIVILTGGKLEPQKKEKKMIQENNLETATFGSGCFWCTEAIFDRVEGVKSAASGYAGGTVANPTYKQVCTGTTGHAEVIQLTFDPKKISYDELLEIFWKTHDPTTLNRQGADVGTQYRSVIFFHNEVQRKKAEEYKDKLNKAEIWEDPIVTQIVPFTNFYPAEDYHQEYYANNPDQSYCSLVITPKVEKFEKIFKDKLKKE
jgi:peptide-methionine (S)-S-oxide reductase